MVPFARNVEAGWKRLRRRVPRSETARHRHHLLVRGFAALALFAVLYALIWLDWSSVVWAKDLPAPVEHFFRFITRYGKSDWMLIPTGVFVILLLFVDWSVVSRRIAAAWAEIAMLVYFFFIAVAGAGLTNNLIKWIVGRSRPVLFDPDGPLSFAPFSTGYPHVSFPSGHATNVASAVTVLFLIAPRVGAPLAIVAAVIAVSRVAVGAHYPTDVLAGVLLGVGFAVTLAYVFADARCGFRATPDGGLKPQTVAIRSVLRKGGWHALGAGLRQAIAGSWNRLAESLR